jgi:hypothetical protein
VNKEDEYIFRYPLEERETSSRRDSLLEVIRIQLEGLLSLLSLYQGGKEVKVDGFRLVSEREAIHPIFNAGTPSVRRHARAEEKAPPGTPSLQSPRNAEIYEPRIPHIKRVLESILSVVDVESEGRPVKIDGFRLKNLADWLIPSAGDPAEIIDHLASRCDCRCSFCYLLGNPPSLALEQPERPAAEELEEARTRLKHFSPRGKKALFPTMGSPYEILSHPHALDLLAELRPKTDRPFRLSTNGNHLTRPFIERISSLKPIYLYLSLNSSTPSRRRKIMGMQSPEVAIQSLPLLKEAGIPYAVVIVPWPFPNLEEMLADLEQTIAYADENDAHLVEVSLPGYSQYFSPKEIFNLDEAWSSVVVKVCSRRRENQTPLLVKPSLYEETLHETRFNLPTLVGTVKNSPAAFAGLKPGDLLLSIGGLKVSSRPLARDLLHLHHQNSTPSVSLSFRRGKEVIEVKLQADRHGYPYTEKTDHHLGMIFLGAGFRPSVLEDLKSLILAHGAKRVLFLSSRLVKPVFQQLMQESALFGAVQIQVEVPQNRFFGGNIFMGDLLVVQDFIDVIREYLEQNPPPDLIVIPSTPFSLGQWKRDLTGRVYSDIERAVGIPVALLECEPIYD